MVDLIAPYHMYLLHPGPLGSSLDTPISWIGKRCPIKDRKSLLDMIIFIISVFFYTCFSLRPY